MAEYLAPGVYVEEVSGGAKPIEAVGTSTACFIGFTEKAKQAKVVDGEKQYMSVVGKPIFLTSWEEYVETFGGFASGFYTPLSVYGFFQNGGKRCYMVSLREIPKAGRNLLSQDKDADNKHREFLKVEARTPGQEGESLRAIIEKVMLPKPGTFTSPWKGKLTVQEAESVTTTTTTTVASAPEVHTITLQKRVQPKSGQPKESQAKGGPGKEAEAKEEQDKETADKGSQIAITTQSANSDIKFLEIAVPETEIAGDLTALWAEADKSTREIATLPFTHKVGNKPLFTIQRKTNDTGDAPTVQLETNVSADKIEITVRATKPATNTALTVSKPLEEELSFELYEEGGNITFRLIEPHSTLLDLLEVAPTPKVAWSELKAWRPKNGEVLSLANESDEPALPSNTATQSLLKLKAKKSGNNFRPLTITVDAPPSPKQELPASYEPDERPSFTLLVERLHPITKKWEPKERRLAALKKEQKTVIDQQDKEKPIQVLKVEYLNGAIPKSVDVVVLKQTKRNADGVEIETEIDVQEFDLAQVWPMAQTATLTETTLKIVDSTKLDRAPYSDYQGDTMARTGIGGLADIDDINFICMPDLMRAWLEENDELKKYVQSVQALAIAHCDIMKNRVVILDPPPNKNPQQVRDWRLDEAGYDSSRAVLYYPWIEVMDPATNKTIFVPPSGFVAGVWARNDTNRGVHKAPANEVVQLAINLQFDVGHGHQEILNPNGINCIRALRGMGIRVWGARTLSQSDPEWTYINVRRLFHMIEQSIQRNTMWAVFEPNDQRLWAKLRRDVRNFLMTLYSQGMLFGATPGEAFFVKCDIENNPKYTRDLGQVIVDIGVAPVKPAEFVIFRIRQWSPEDEQG